jgi:hypothetical protein
VLHWIASVFGGLSERDIKHFLVVYGIAARRTKVQSFGTDYDAAMKAYAEAEEVTRERGDLDIVLLSADSLETIKCTHSSYFDTEESFERLLPPGVLTL